MNPDTRKIAAELLIAVRGGMARSAMARRLGASADTVHRWETGERRIGWDDFVRFCDAAGVPLGEALTRISYHGDSGDGSALSRQILGSAVLSRISEETGISRFSMMRWCQGKSMPALADILMLLHHCQFLMLEFIAMFVDIGHVPTAFELYDQRQRRKEVYYRLPIVAAVLCCLKLDEYRQFPSHRQGFIAGKLGISAAEEQQALLALEEVGKVRLHDGLYVPVEEQLELTDSRSFNAFCTYWLQRAADYTRSLEHPLPVIGYGMDIQPASRATLKALREEYCAFYQRVRTILNQDQGPKDSVYIFHSLFFDLDRRQETPARYVREPLRPAEETGRSGDAAT